ncbi:hypothetical protein AOL_s00007g42 [Orbilia oligospora ATCC 24927]|uniref:Uncharacterized protein n=1 Tax=Arthrobotrys oligospora (strain ATCC 24927 / CBS 115.81 / DSM 1491) TaxID=756982 RepID=G1X183_ARTOA|nr:hypothetical protein AOL_s00007g42 [Orbilia oligospora ATCC 24927]EGX53093.1 hypothetical protein AOL_s00007g42 [Orbilia oligospora ATCC 24927]
MSPRSSSSSRSPPSKSKNPRPKKTPLTILLSYTATASSLRSQLETDLTTIRKRIRRAKYHNIPQTNLLSIIASIKQLADIYATTAMAYVTARNTAELYAISASALEKLMRVEEELKKFDNVNLGGDDDGLDCSGASKEGRRDSRREGEYERRERRKEEVRRESALYYEREGRRRKEPSDLNNTLQHDPQYANYRRNDESSSFTPEGARSPPSSTRQLRPPRPPHAVSSPRQTQQPDCENPYAETIEGRFELMGVPDLGGRRRERYNVFQTGRAGLGSDVHVKTVPAKKPDVHVKTVPVKKPEAVEVGRGAETEKPVRPVYGTVKVIPAKGRLVKRLLENKRN